MTFRILTAASALALAAAPALAASPAVTTSDLNLRVGPGTAYDVAGVMPARSSIDLAGCIADSSWCEVTYDGVTGYAWAPHIAMTVAGAEVPLTEVKDYDIVTFQSTGDVNAYIGDVEPTAVGPALSVIPLDGALTAPDGETIAYIGEYPVEPIFVDGEVTVGSVLPDDAPLRKVPGGTFLYTNVNGQPVLVNPANRQIVHIAR
ncbi:DUF1236 domain-containing protein [Jannaschia rubra]|uniref:SH3b domain-containing protein n=1 Tax=Jannaschia rubra TaxID=282197 RepID=A0A0M6XSV0_9RHOB|nr:DUF1236 domain-containing protein [Jannaschia rubra]CTQ34246.1 hypothetical protein JAN5088_03039 [Jannaschia rubra]SFG19626.1 SH3 domain-containing protein [Jannaschia rubra]